MYVKSHFQNSNLFESIEKYAFIQKEKKKNKH